MLDIFVCHTNKPARHRKLFVEQKYMLRVFLYIENCAEYITMNLTLIYYNNSTKNIENMIRILLYFDHDGFESDSFTRPVRRCCAYHSALCEHIGRGKRCRGVSSHRSGSVLSALIRLWLYRLGGNIPQCSDRGRKRPSHVVSPQALC